MKRSCRISALTNLKVENKHAHLLVITEAEYFSRPHQKIDSPNRTQHLPADILLLLCPSLYSQLAPRGWQRIRVLYIADFEIFTSFSQS